MDFIKKLAQYNTFILASLLIVKVIFYLIYRTSTIFPYTEILFYFYILHNTKIIFCLVILYSLSFFGIINKKKWGSILAGGTIISEIIFMFIIGENFAFFNIIIIHLIILFLAYKEYKQISSTSKEK